jgi:hypothetical protein
VASATAALVLVRLLGGCEAVEETVSTTVTADIRKSDDAGMLVKSMLMEVRGVSVRYSTLLASAAGWTSHLSSTLPIFQ